MPPKLPKPDPPPKTRQRDRTGAERQRRYRARQAIKVAEAMRFKAASEAQRVAERSALESAISRMNEYKLKYEKLQSELKSEIEKFTQLRNFFVTFISRLSPAIKQSAITKARALDIADWLNLSNH